MARRRTTIDYQTPADDLAALADPARLQIVDLLRNAGDNGLNVTQLIAALAASRGLSQPTVSHHLARLLRAGLVAWRKTGSNRIYCLVQDRLPQLARVVADGVEAGQR